MSNRERQKALEAKGYTFERRNSKRKWVHHTSSSRRFTRLLDILEKELLNEQVPSGVQELERGRTPN